MNYWHMNLHPTGDRMDDLGIKKIVLSRTIGMGIWDESDGPTQRDDFKNRVKENDIVAIVNGQTSIALVEIIGDWYEFSLNEEGNSEDSYHLDKESIIWFILRRPVKILDLKKVFIPNDFPSRTKTLKIASDKESATYQFIEKWHNECVSSFKTKMNA